MSLKRAKQITIFLGITVTFLVVALYYMQIDFIESFEARTYDMRQQSIRHSISPDKDIVIIAIDDKSVAELGRFPWSREFFADFIDYASQSKAKAILLDVIFPEDQSI